MTIAMSVRPAGGAAHEAEEVAAAIPAEASHVRSEHWFQRLARVGLTTRAVIYALLAYIAAEIAFTHRSPAQANGSGALSEVGRQPAGRVLLGLLAVGLVGYGLWRVAQALSREDQGEKRRPEARTISTVERVGWLCTALIYLFLCGQAAVLVFSANSGASGGGGPSAHPQPFVATVLRWPGGPVWVGLAGAGLAIGGGALVVWGSFHDYSEVLDTRRMSQKAFLGAQVTGIAGEAARGLLIVIVSVYLLAAAAADNPARAKSTNQALLSLDRVPVGQGVLVVTVVGLLCFAVYSLFEAVYRDV
jgi:Domain of Unknown Function (DUF1206)